MLITIFVWALALGFFALWAPFFLMFWPGWDVLKW